LPDILMTYRWAARAEAVTRKSGEMGNRHRHPRTRSLGFWCGRKGRCSITIYGTKNGRSIKFQAQVAPTISVVAEDVTEAIVGGGMGGIAPGGR
jgi:hypothetical protein